MSLFVKKGDEVVILSGEDKGKKAKVLVVEPESNKVIIEGVNYIKKHTKPRSAQQAGGIIKKEGAINAAKVQVVCPTCGKATRTSVKTDENGKKLRLCKACGASVEKLADKSDRKAKAAAKTAVKKAKPAKEKEIKTETEVKVKKKKDTETKE